MFLFLAGVSCLKDSDPLITQELVDKINSNPNAPFRAVLNPKFSQMTIGDAKRFLSPIKPLPKTHGSAVPVGANENFMHNLDKQYITGYTNVAGSAKWEVQEKDEHGKPIRSQKELFIGPIANQEKHKDEKPLKGKSLSHSFNNFKFPVFDVTKLCSSWAAAVTSAMTITVSRWNGDFVNFSLQYVLDCDMLGDSCIERTPLNAYQLFWERHPPTFNGWDDISQEGSERHGQTSLTPPRSDFTREHCKDEKCYPGMTNCEHAWALTGSCNPGDPETICPVYFLYNWRWIKSHLWEVGAVTSSILVYQSFFAFNGGATDAGNDVYTSAGDNTEPLGMLDVTIIGWGQKELNLSTSAETEEGHTPEYSKPKNRWWWVIPHLGQDFYTNTQFTQGNNGEAGTYVYDTTSLKSTGAKDEALKSTYQDGVPLKLGVMKFNRRFDDCNIESHAVGAVPFNFIPHPWRTPESKE